MYSTTTIVKSSRLNGRLLGTHQRLDLAARKVVARELPVGKYFPSGKEIIHFEGTRGPDGLKRKSPGEDEPSHMLEKSLENSAPAGEDHGSLDERSVYQLITDHHWNLTEALRRKDYVRAAFEAAWLAHMITDGLTPAHHFPLAAVKEELMTEKEMLKVLGEPVKGVMRGRNPLETMRNNWLYWGARGAMTQHVAYEYGVLMLVASLPTSRLIPKNLDSSDFSHIDLESEFQKSLRYVQGMKMYDRFRAEGWTTDLAFATRDQLLPEIVRMIALAWFSACTEAYKLKKR